MTIRSFPFVICGKRWAHQTSRQTCTTKSGEEIQLPAIDQKLVDCLRSQPADLLSEVPLYEIIGFLNAVGQRWKSKEYARRRSYVSQLQQYFGYTEKMANAEADWIALLLCSHVTMHDMVANELGSRHILDRWIFREESEVKAIPRGRVLHILPGNVPVSAIVSILRSIITKNITIAKTSSDDYFTALNLALSFRDVNDEHPVTRSVSIMYWPGGCTTDAVTEIIKLSDAACVWGGREAIDWASRNLRTDAELIRFGPKRSMGIVGKDADVKLAAEAAAHDISVYNQDACFSVLQLFVEQISESFVPALQTALSLYSEELLPPLPQDFDESAACTLSTLEAEFLGAEIHRANDLSWSIIVGPPTLIGHHPRSRTIYVHPVESVEVVKEYINSDIQTLAVMPPQVGLAVRDACANRGVSRIVELGLNNVFRLGSSHDGMYPLQRMVRFVSFDMASAVHPKGITFSIGQTSILKEDRFLELVP